MKSLNQAEKQARAVVDEWSVAAAALGWLPGSQFFLAGVDLKMIKNVARAFDVESYNATQITATITASVGGKTIAHTLLDFIPGFGGLIKSVTAAGVTKVVGEIVINYFKERTPLV